MSQPPYHNPNQPPQQQPQYPPQNGYPNTPYPGPPQGPRVVVTKRGANHGLHVFLTIITCGLWAVTGWPIAALMGRKTKTRTY
ncbi:hypothetical protein [Streptomyces galilaeus]|uniref:Uncharacterized protein n=1 Tax=Streptomyces galilaeus TaxID=33899 RepID=A0ABW9IPE6_STRGJ